MIFHILMLDSATYCLFSENVNKSPSEIWLQYPMSSLTGVDPKLDATKPSSVWNEIIKEAMVNKHKMSCVFLLGYIHLGLLRNDFSLVGCDRFISQLFNLSTNIPAFCCSQTENEHCNLQIILARSKNTVLIQI